MAYGNIFHAICLHLHQPPGNLELLINANDEEARQIIHCYDRVTRYAHQYADVARLHIGFSGILLEQLRKPEVVDRYRHHMDIPAMLDSYRKAENIEFIDMGHYHPVFPLIPMEDWEEQLLKGRQLITEAFGKAPRGFYPPEMAFTIEMIPVLVKAGYEYVIIDANCVKPYGEQLDIYQPYRVCYEDACITVIPFDPDISNAQVTGLETYWFANEMYHRIQHSAHPEAPRLLTSWSDGENSAWFRQMDESANFFGQFFAMYMDHVRSARYPVRPLFISEFIRQHPTEVATHVETGAWHVGDTVGYELPQWNGSDAQRHAITKIRELNNRYRQLKKQTLSSKSQATLEEAHRLVLEGESSCFLFWGDEWLQRLYDRLNPAEALLAEIEKTVKLTATPAEENRGKPVQATSKVETSPVEKPKPIRPTPSAENAVSDIKVDKEPTLKQETSTPKQATTTTDKSKTAEPVLKEEASVKTETPKQTAGKDKEKTVDPKQAKSTETVDAKTGSGKATTETSKVTEPEKSSATDTTKQTTKQQKAPEPVVKSTKAEDRKSSSDPTRNRTR
jgi:hypothetical protein